MRKIIKKPEPHSLTEYRLSGEKYDGANFTPIKDEIRLSLLEEQGHLCAYCMARISVGNMKVEHWAPQDKNSQLQLYYSNMLGCCMGSQGERLVDQTCDSRKGNSALKFNPSRTQDRINEIIRYNGQGEIFSTDAEFSTQLNTILNLNKVRLIDNRARAIGAIRSKLSNKTGTRTKAEISRILNQFKYCNANGLLTEYLGIIEWYLSP